MEHKLDFIDGAFYREIYQEMVDSEEYADLKGCLVLMQTDRGIGLEEAKENADRIVEAVAVCESGYQKLQENVEDTVKSLLKDVKEREDCDLTMHKLYFGLTVHQDPEAAEIIRGGVSVEELFWRYYQDNENTKTTGQLEADIYQALRDYRLSDTVLKALAKKMECTDGYLATAEALGKGSLNFKCISAMELYLNSEGDLSIPEAANLAGTGVEIQSAADAVGRGLITRETAKKILIVAGIAAVVIGVAVAVYYAGSAAALTKAAASVTDLVIPLPETFAAFSETTGGSIVLRTAAESVEQLYVPRIAAAKQGKLIGGVIMALGAGTVVLSKKTATLLGKFRAGFAENKEHAAEGARDMAEHAVQQSQVSSTTVRERAKAKAFAVQKAEQTVAAT